ncbi:hypothetical protein F7D13_13105 [Methylocystis rosea]|uniref:Uncharacterized protein n=1 Tax=Methylocystis rosea TaxID=173366 RepID=A0ABX6EKL6_9HYPH|nr:hypothetical protein [Methylocystis rosea]QGM94884.1 hypothetical protein F7D13_13105 [Methylocystis rosea]
MRLVTYSIVGAACALGILFTPIAQAANAPLCLAIAQNYNTCMRQHQYGRGGGHDGYGPGYGQGYGRGYRGGYPGDDDGDYDGDGGYGGYGGYGGGYGGGSPRRRYENAKAACAIWFAQMQASGCFN